MSLTINGLRWKMFEGVNIKNAASSSNIKLTNIKAQHPNKQNSNHREWDIRDMKNENARESHNNHTWRSLLQLQQLPGSSHKEEPADFLRSSRHLAQRNILPITTPSLKQPQKSLLFKPFSQKPAKNPTEKISFYPKISPYQHPKVSHLSQFAALS